MGGDPKCDGHKLPCLFEAGSYEAHYMTTGSKERIFPHTFVFDRSYDAVGGGRVDVLRCSVCDYIVPVKSHVHDYGWNWDCTGFGSIYEYTFNIGGSTKTVEQLILESGYAHPEKCKVPGCEEFIMVPHSWGRWNVVKAPDTEGDKGGMEAECSICEYTKTKIDKDDDEGTDHWTKDTALVTVKNGRATRMIVKPGDKIKLYPEERTGQKAIGWKVEYLREYNVSDSTAPVHKNWSANEAKSQFKLVTNGSALEWGCTIPEFSAMGAPGGGSFFFEPVYAGCDHSGGTTVLNAKEQICDRKATPATPPAQTAAMSSVPVRISTHLQTPVIPVHCSRCTTTARQTRQPQTRAMVANAITPNRATVGTAPMRATTAARLAAAP